MIFGSGVAGPSVLPSMHSPSTFDFTIEGKKRPSIPHADILLHPTPVLNTHVLQTRVLAIVAHLHAGNCCCYSRTSISRPLSCCCSPTRPGRAVHSSRGLIVPLTHRSFWVFPRRSFPVKSRKLWLSKVGIFSLPLHGLCVFSQ